MINLPNVFKELYLLKQHSPAHDSAYNILDYIAFGYFDGIVFGNEGQFQKDHYLDFDFDCFDLSTYYEVAKYHSHVKDICVENTDQPYFMVTMLQLLPFCTKRCGNIGQYELLSHVSDAYESSINKCLAELTDQGIPENNKPKIQFYPFFSYGQVDIVLITQGNSLAFMYGVLEDLMHSTRYSEGCYANESQCEGCSDIICFTSSYSVCGILSAKDSILESLHISQEGPSRDKYLDAYKIISDRINSIDYNTIGKLSFIYETYVKNSRGTKAYLGKYLSQFLNSEPNNTVDTLGVVGNYDYAYSIVPKNKEELAKALYLSASLCDENPCIAGTSLDIQIRISVHDDSENNYIPDNLTDTYKEIYCSKQGESRDNRKFERIFWALYHLSLDDSDASTPVSEAARRLKGELFDKHNNAIDDGWETNEWKTLSVELDEMYYYCYQLASSHFSSGIGTMLIQPLNCLYDIYEKALRYALDLRVGWDDDTIRNPLQKEELSIFMDKINIVLSSLMLSTNSIIETRDFHSCELNSHTKYLVAYYVFMKDILKNMAPTKRIEVLVTTTNDLKTTVKKVMQKYCIYPHKEGPHGLYILSIPMLHLKNPQVLIPILIHEAGHMIGDIQGEDSFVIKKDCQFDIYVESVTAGLFPEGALARGDFHLEAAEIWVGNFEERVALSSSMFGTHSAKFDKMCKKFVHETYGLIKKKMVPWIKNMIKKELFLDADDDWQEILLEDYKVLLDKNMFLSEHFYERELMEDDNSIPSLIRKCQIKIIRSMLDEIHSSYALSDALYVSEKTPLSRREFNTALINTTSSIDDIDGSASISSMQYKDVCFQMMNAANEIYADIYMIKKLGLRASKRQSPKLYLKCFTDEDWNSLEYSLANVFRVCYILELYYGLSKDAIYNCILSRTEAIEDVDATSFVNIYTKSIYAEKKNEKDCLTIRELFLPIFKNYIDKLGDCFDLHAGVRNSDFTKEIKPWRFSHKNSGWNKKVVYSLWRDIRTVRELNDV